jgi:hypothetical protein
LFHFSIYSIPTLFSTIITLIGSILMPKYHNKKPTFYEVKRLLDKENTKHPEGLKYDIEIYLEPPIGGRAEEMKVPKSVAWELKIRRKAPLCILVVGSCLLIIKLFF